MSGSSEEFHKSMVLIRQNRLTEALEILEPLCNSGHADAEVWCWSGIAQLSSGQLDGAELALRQSVILAAQNPVANFALGTLLRKQQEWDEALIYLQKALAGGQVAANVYWSIGVCLVWLQRHREAIEMFHRGLEMEPDSASICYNIAAAHDQRHDNEEARDFATRALNNEPDHARSAILLARLDTQEKKYSASRQRLQGLIRRTLSPFVALAQRWSSPR